MENPRVSVSRMILVPGLITLAVTVLRLVGELNRWSEVFFKREAGGAGAIVGIVWLAFLFAIFFALRLQAFGVAFEKPAKGIGLAVVSIALCFAGSVVMLGGGRVRLAIGIVIIMAAIFLMRFAWPKYWNVMLAYALAARIPVLIVMFFAILGNWGTHYDAVEPNGSSYSGFAAKFIQLGLVPQLFFWIPFTVVICGLFGLIAAAIGGALRKRPAPAAAA